MTSHTARINSRLLSQYKGHTVRLTAKVLKIVGETATVQASDGGEVSGLELCSCLLAESDSVLNLLSGH